MGLHAEGRDGSDRLNIISLCTGGGGLDFGVELAIPAACGVCYLERESFGIAALVEAMREGRLADAPVWSDVSTFRGRPWRGLVDGVIGGIPCQPYSVAGAREGAEDERDLWPHTRRIINAVRPWLVLIENVGGMLVGSSEETAGAARVRRDLAAMSYRTEIVLVRAAETGASHDRARVFILALRVDVIGPGEWGSMADAGDPGSQGGERGAAPGQRQRAAASRPAAELRRTRMVNTDDGRRGKGRPQSGLPGGRADAAIAGDSVRAGELGDAERARRAETGPGSEIDAGPESQPRGGGMADAESLGLGKGIGEPEARSGRPAAPGGRRAVADPERGGHGRDAGAPGRRAIGRTPVEGAGAGISGDELADSGHIDGPEIETGDDGEPEQRAAQRGRSVVAAGTGTGRPDSGGRISAGHAATTGSATVDGRHDGKGLADAGFAGDEPAGDAGDVRPAQGESAPLGEEWERFWRHAGDRSAAAGTPFLYPPGPGNRPAWSDIAAAAAHLLPALSKHDRFRLALGDARALADGDPARRAWLDETGPYGLRPAIVQALAQSVFRGMADGLVSRVDQLRMLGNGVVPLQAAYALRLLLALHLRGEPSPYTARLVRMMAL